MILSPAEPTVTAVLLIVGYSGEKYFQTARKFKVPNSAKKTPLTPHSTQEPLCAIPHQLVTSGQRPLLFGVRRDLMRVTSEECTIPAIRHWHTTPLTSPRQCLIHTNPRSAACAISTAQDFHPDVWSNSSSGIGSASIPALCNNRLCLTSTLRFAVWSNSSSGTN